MSDAMTKPTLRQRIQLVWRGLKLRPRWTFGNGGTSDRLAVLASYHHPQSITWRWSLMWRRPEWTLPRSKRMPKREPCEAEKRVRERSTVKHGRGLFGLVTWMVLNQSGHVDLRLPIVGWLTLSWQDHMWR